MTNYTEGSSVNIHGCNYEITEDYLSAKSNGSYPKVLAKILGIADINAFVQSVLGYSNYDGRKFGYKNMEDANKLIDALQNYKGVEVKKSNILTSASVKKYFENTVNLERLEMLTTNISELLNNFNRIKNIATNVINKTSIKNVELVSAIDNQDLTSIKKIEGEFKFIVAYITDTNEILAKLNEVGSEANVTPTDFNAEEFMNA